MLIDFVDLKSVQREGCELSFIGGSMRTIAWEAASQTALRYRCREVGEGQHMCDVGERKVHTPKHTPYGC